MSEKIPYGLSSEEAGAIADRVKERREINERVAAMIADLISRPKNKAVRVSAIAEDGQHSGFLYPPEIIRAIKRGRDITIHDDSEVKVRSW